MARIEESGIVKVIWLLVALGLSSYFAMTLWLAWRGIFFPYQLDYGEGIVLWFTRELALGHSVYFGWGPPYAPNNYPPVGMLMASVSHPLFGDKFIMGRWLNFAGAAIVSAFIYRFVSSESKNRVAAGGLLGMRAVPALLATLLFLGSTFVYHWIPLFRVDLIGLAFTLVGVFFVWQWERSAQIMSRPTTSEASAGSMRRFLSPLTTHRELLFAVFFFLAALYTKHSLVFAPAAAGVAIFLRNRRAGILFALGLAATGGGIFAVLEKVTRGGFSFGLIQANATVWTPRVFLPLMLSYLSTYAVLIVLAAWSWWQRVRAIKFGILEIYALATIASLALAGREGAWQNYFFEAIVAVSIFAGISIAHLLARRLWWLPFVLLVQLALFWNEHDPAIALKLFQEVEAGNQHTAPLVRAAQGTIISEDMGLLVTNGKPVAYYTFPYSTLARAGKWDQHWELDNLWTGNFPLVILNQGTREDVDHFGDFTRAFMSALDFGYARTTEDVRYAVYEPAPLAHLQSAVFDDRIELVGWTLEPAESQATDPSTPLGLHAGQFVKLQVVWRALKSLPGRYTTFAHLERGDGEKAAQDDHEPHAGLYPTPRWAAGEMVRETYSLRVNSELATGDYFLRVGWYDSATQDRMTLGDGVDFVQLEKFSAP